MPLDADLKALAQAKHFAALTTLMPDGQPQTQIMWVHADDDHVLINTTVGRQKFRNVQADPRVTVTVFDESNPYRYIEARGRDHTTWQIAHDGPLIWGITANLTRNFYELVLRAEAAA